MGMPRMMSTRVVETVLAVLMAVGVLLAITAPAEAHAVLVGSSPAEGAQVDVLPGEVSFEFNEEMSAPAYVVVRGPDGASVTTGEPTVAGRTVVQTLRTNAATQGTYTMAYRAVSVDGHPVTGQVSFTVGEAAPVPGTTSEPEVTPSKRTPAATSAATEQDGTSRTLMVVGVGVLLFLVAAGLWLFAGRRAS